MNTIYFLTLPWLGLTWYDMSRNRKKKKMKNQLMAWTLYTSKRFCIQGNIGWKLEIKDYTNNRAYLIQYGDLVKFRTYWHSIKEENRDQFIVVNIVNQPSKVLNRKMA